MPASRTASIAFALILASLASPGLVHAEEPAVPPTPPSSVTGAFAALGVLATVVAIGSFAIGANALVQPDPSQHVTGEIATTVGVVHAVGALGFFFVGVPWALSRSSWNSSRRTQPRFTAAIAPAASGVGAMVGVTVVF